MSSDDRARWEERYRAGEHPSEASPFLVSLDPLLPRAGRALDVAGGAGRHALWLARRGLDVVLVDIAENALAIAEREAARLGVERRLSARRLDLVSDPLPDGPFDLAVCWYFLDRAVFGRMPEVLAPGGLLVIVHPTRKNLERNPRPSARFVLEDGELVSLVPGVEVISSEEGWFEGGRHEARLVARRSGQRSVSR